MESVHSLFWWQETIEDAEETLVLMKTKSELFKEISEHIIKLHSYKTPEIIAVPITSGSEPYLKWISSVVKS
jgi:periplasmic divalent cation tolerance protein